MTASKKWPEFLSSASDPEPDSPASDPVPDDSIEDFEAALDLDSLTLDDLQMPGHDRMGEQVQLDRGGRSKLRLRPMPILLALLVLISLGTMVFYAYTWMTGGSADGDLPVVQAIDDPIKVKPASPGGLEVPYQEQLVLNQDESSSSGEPVVERLLPPPEAPAWQPAATESQGAASDVDNEPSAVATAPSGNETARTAAPVAPVADEPAPATVAPVVPPKKPVVSQRTEAADEGRPVAAEAPKTAARVTQPAAGGFRVQLASLTSYEATAAAWKNLKQSHPGLLGELPLHVQQAQVSGKTYYRVQVGVFASRAEAGALCARLKTRQQDCLVVKR